MITIHESAQNVVRDWVSARAPGWKITRVQQSEIPDRHEQVEGKVWIQGPDESGDLTDTFVRYRIPASEEAVRRACVAALERFIPAELRDAR